VFPPYSDKLKVLIIVIISAFLVLSTFREKRTAILILGFVLVKIIKTHIHYEIFILFFFSALFLLLIYRDLEVWGRILIWFLLGYLVFLFFRRLA
jgi:Ca2+/Na+ antiporter